MEWKKDILEQKSLKEKIHLENINIDDVKLIVDLDIHIERKKCYSK